MEYAFLRDFPRRMKVVGMYAVLLSNSGQKQKWKQYGFDTEVEQINLLFATLLFIMEQSLREEPCTVDDVAGFLDVMNTRYCRKCMTFDECRDLADFIVNTVLSNEGLRMSFQGYHFEKKTFEDIHISYVANRIVYDAFENRRTSYYLTENGYSLLLGTLEVENNMRLTLQEIIFNEHLKKRNFDKALDNIKNIFELMRIEKLKNYEAITRMRQNILDFSIEDYSQRIDSTFSSITNTRTKLERYKKIISDNVKKIRSEDVDIDHIEDSDKEKLDTLREINKYLDSSIDCYMEIMQSYNTYRDICAQEMENFLQISRVERFSFTSDLFNRILDNGLLLASMDRFLHPLFMRTPSKIFNLNKVLVPQRRREDGQPGQELEDIDFDEAAWREEQERKQALRTGQYETCLSYILQCVMRGGKDRVLLSEIAARIEAHPDELERLVPTVSVFKEVMVELIRSEHFDMETLRAGRAERLEVRGEEEARHAGSLVIGDLLLSLSEERRPFRAILHFSIRRTEEGGPVIIESVPDMSEEGERLLTLRCTDTLFQITRKPG
ncbi:MAG: hypothetical protein K5657_00185 [Desulfovibrio sp.]|nr:hypothetical protein [Desulfovibrio sp.]